jgi:hypothetical protein
MSLTFGYAFDVSIDDQRFLISVPIGDAAKTPITVVLNWIARLKR